MIKNILSDMGGIEVYGIISLILFFVVFFGMLIWACALKKQSLDEMSQLPLDNDPEDSTEGLHRHE